MTCLSIRKTTAVRTIPHRAVNGTFEAHNAGKPIMIRAIQLAVACAAVLVATAGPVQADIITVQFPSSDSTTFTNYSGLGTLGAGGGGIHYVAGDYIEKTFTGTGLANATSSHWVFDMSDFTASNVTNSFDVFINGTTVGSYSFNGGGGRNEHFDLIFNHPAPVLGDTYTLKIVATSTVYPGGGSWNWFPGGQVTLTGTDPSAATPVPEPSSLAIFGVGLIGMAIRAARGRRRVAQTI